MVNDIMH